jgi:hypothetical protein
MYRAASTWQYNVAGHLVERYRAGKRLGYCSDARLIETVLDAPSAPDSWQVLKAHEPYPILAEMLARGEALALYSYRDLRDVAYSVIHKRASTFEAAIEADGVLIAAIAGFRFWTAQPRTLIQRYEQLVVDPVAGVRAIAAHLEVPLPPGAAGEIAREFSLEKNRQRAREVARQFQSLGMDLSDPANALCCDELSQWHWNHIRDGRVGGWRRAATPRELSVLARQCGGWLIEQGYEQDDSWSATHRRPDLRSLGKRCLAGTRRLLRMLWSGLSRSV